MNAAVPEAMVESPRAQSTPGAGTAAESVRSEVGYIPAIEGLRGIAVLWVVVFHYVVVRSGQFADPVIEWIDASPVASIFVRNGFLGVDLFFLITGFLLTLPWFKHAFEKRGHPSAREFYIRRARRILPAYYVQLAMLFLVFLPLLKPTLWHTARLLVLANLGVHVLFLHYTTPYSSASLGVNGALWTLAIEMQYYLLLPLIAMWFLRAPWIAAGAFFAASLVWKTLALHDLQPLISIFGAMNAGGNVPETALRQFLGTQLPAYLGHFALGILCGRAWLRNRTLTPDRTRALLLGVLAAGALLGLYAILAGHAAWLGERSRAPIPVLLAIVLWAAVSKRPPWGKKLLGFAPLTYIGRISYSMYLYHLPLLLLFNKYAPAALAGLAFPCYFAAVAATSTASFHFVEWPFMRGTKRMTLKPAPLSPAP